MSECQKDEIDIFEQLDEALEEREGKDRRRENMGFDQGEDRRQGDRRDKAGASAQK